MSFTFLSQRAVSRQHDVMSADSAIHTHSPWLIVRQFVGHVRSLRLIEHYFASIQADNPATVHHTHNVVAAVRVALDDTTRGVAGCGMDGRCIRVGTENHKWYDVDFPEVIEERKRYFTESADYRMIAGDARDCTWLAAIPETKAAIVVMEGVSMYLTVDEMRNLADSLCAHFENLMVLVDCYTSFAAKMSKRRNPINDVGVTEVYGIDNPQVYQNGELAFAKEHTMIPEKYIDELKGFEKFIFANLYAGGFSKKLYRLFEYKKN